MKRANARLQRVALEEAETGSQRVTATDSNPNTTPIVEDGSATQRVPATNMQEADDGLRMPGLEVTYPSNKGNNSEPLPPLVSQDYEGPSQNTRASRRQ